MVLDNDKEAKAGKQTVSKQEPTPDENDQESKAGKQAVTEEPIQDNAGVVDDDGDEKEAKAGKTLSEEGNADVESEGTE